MALRLTAASLSNADRLWHLHQSPLVSGLGSRDVRVLAEFCRDFVAEKETVLFEPGGRADSILILNRGYVRVSVVSNGGQEKIIDILKSGELFGENFLGSGTHRTKAVAHEESWITSITKTDFLRLAGEQPLLLTNLVKILSIKLDQARSDIENLSCMMAEQRIAATLLRMGLSHGKPVPDNQSKVKLKIAFSHQQLADMTGGNRPHVSTIMSRFKKSGLVSYQGRRLLLDTEALRQQLPKLG